jgi:hypothetical protein
VESIEQTSEQISESVGAAYSDEDLYGYEDINTIYSGAVVPKSSSIWNSNYDEYTVNEEKLSHKSFDVSAIRKAILMVREKNLGNEPKARLKGQSVDPFLGLAEEIKPGEQGSAYRWCSLGNGTALVVRRMRQMYNPSKGMHEMLEVCLVPFYNLKEKIARQDHSTKLGSTATLASLGPDPDPHDY